MAVVALLALSVLPGCSRNFWRSQADFDTYNQLLMKTRDPRWDLPRVTVDADYRSRFYDPFDLAKPPLPPDDPAAHEYMHMVDGMTGYKSWHKFGQLMSVENPQWLENIGYAPRIEQASWETNEGDSTEPIPSVFDLTLPQAIELANIHNREYQFQIENAYLSALALTFQQFQYNVRYLGVGGRTPSSNLSLVDEPSNADYLSASNRFGVSQVLPTGGQWVAELANNTLWLFSGGQSSSSSVLTFSLTQPLLQGAGRKIQLENLTQTERDVLYDIRTLARYRKIFFGNTVVNGPSGGFLGLLQTSQTVENQRENIRALVVQIERLREIYNVAPKQDLANLPDNFAIPPELGGKLLVDRERRQGASLSWRGDMSDVERDRLFALSDDPEFQRAVQDLAARVRSGTIPLDLAQLLTRLSQQEIQLRGLERQYADQRDSFKFDLGLPPDMQMTIDTSLIRQFQLIDPRLTEAESRLLGFVERVSVVPLDNPDQFVQQFRQILPEVRSLIEAVEHNGFDIVRDDFRRVDADVDNRLSRLQDAGERALVQRNHERDQFMFRDAEQKFGELKEGFELLLEHTEGGKSTPEETIEELRTLRESLLQSVQSLKVIQAVLRAELIELQEFTISQDQAVQLALENRLDLMNARGGVMDARRQVEITANRLQSVLNVVARGDVGTAPGNKPFDFRADESQFQAGLQFSSPLDQVQQRNAFRQAIVNYQRARRDYMALEDSIKRTVRSEWRQLAVLRPNFETNRQNLRFSAMQLDSAILESTKPPAAGQANTAGRAGSGNTGLNLQNALQAILTAQNGLIQSWIQYEQNRINIFRDMDIMQIDERGLWIDPVYQELADRPNPPASEPANELPPPPDAASLGLPPEPEWLVRLLEDVAPFIREDPRGESADLAGGLAGSGRSRGVVRLASDQQE